MFLTDIKISVCVPVYATENVLKNCLCSIASQNFDSFEIILVDDCSPGVKDSKLTVKSVVKEIQKEFEALLVPRVCRNRQRYHGISRTFKKGNESSLLRTY